MMHAFLHGVIMYVVEAIMPPLNPAEKYHLDTIVDEIVVPVRSSMKTNFPRCSFTCEITKILLTADERAGAAFVVALVAVSRPGVTMLKKAAKRSKRARKEDRKLLLN